MCTYTHRRMWNRHADAFINHRMCFLLGSLTMLFIFNTK